VWVNCSLDCRLSGGGVAAEDSCGLEIKLVNSTGGTPDGLSFHCGTEGDGCVADRPPQPARGCWGAGCSCSVDGLDLAWTVRRGRPSS